MPVIAQRLVQIHANDDMTVSIIDKINECGCIKTLDLSNKLDIPLRELKNTLRHIAGLKCDPDFEICCTNETTFNEFTKKLGRLK